MVLSSQMQRRVGGGGYMTRTRRQRRQRNIKRLVIFVFVVFLGFVIWSYVGQTDPISTLDGSMVVGPENGNDGNDGDGVVGGGAATPGVGRLGSDGSGGTGALTNLPTVLISEIQDPPPKVLSTPVPVTTRPNTDQATQTPNLLDRAFVADTSAPSSPPSTPSTPSTPDPSEDQSLAGTVNPYGAPHPESSRLVTAAEQMVLNGQLVEARRMINQALAEDPGSLRAADWRRQLEQINDTLVFSPSVKFIDDDPLAETYIVKSGESLSVIAGRYGVPWQFIAHINGIKNARSLRAGQRIKIVKGPFRAEVHKLDYRLDVYAGDVFIRSFRVGLGEHDLTPVGAFKVSRGKKLENPEWTNPRTGERVLADDPKNPLGEYWIGLTGIDEQTRMLDRYGIHGTIFPETIGTQASMGCVRMLAPDIERVYQMLNEESLVDIMD